MIALGLQELRVLGLGALDAAPGAEKITGVQIDSRRVGPGDLFVGVGPGVEFADDARASGASAVLVPEDAHHALARIAALVRAQSGATVVGITGSTGKTSTKDILAALCAPHRRVVAAEASFNNELGVPLTLCRLEPDTELCILELGMRGFGQIAALCAVARPDVGVITRIGPAHLEVVGTVDGVARAKAELVNSLPPGGIAVIPSLPALEQHIARDDLDLRRFDPERDLELDGRHARFHLGDRAVELELPFDQRHQAENTLAALHVYDALGLPLDRASEGLADVRFSAWRGELLPLPGGGLVVNDAYNANPDSMRAALHDLVARAGSRRRVVILGDMAELGTSSAEHHEAIGGLVAGLGIEVLVAVGPEARGYLVGGAEEQHHVVAAAEVPLDLVRPDDAVLVKASRAVGLEGIASALANRQ